MSGPYNFGLGNVSSPQSNIFGVSCPDPITGINSFGSTSSSSSGRHYSLLPQLSNSNSSHYNLGLNPSGQTPQQLFGTSTAASLNAALMAPPSTTMSTMEFLQSGQAKPTNTILDLSLSVGSFTLPALGVVQTANDMVNTSFEATKAIHDSNKGTVEATICQAANTAASKTVSALGDGALFLGIPAVAVVGTSNPLLGAAAITTAIQLLPQAYANKEKVAGFAGEKAEDYCHKLFNSNSN